MAAAPSVHYLDIKSWIRSVQLYFFTACSLGACCTLTMAIPVPNVKICMIFGCSHYGLNARWHWRVWFKMWEVWEDGVSLCVWGV